MSTVRVLFFVLLTTPVACGGGGSSGPQNLPPPECVATANRWVFVSSAPYLGNQLLRDPTLPATDKTYNADYAYIDHLCGVSADVSPRAELHGKRWRAWLSTADSGSGAIPAVLRIKKALKTPDCNAWSQPLDGQAPQLVFPQSMAKDRLALVAGPLNPIMRTEAGYVIPPNDADGRVWTGTLPGGGAANQSQGLCLNEQNEAWSPLAKGGTARGLYGLARSTTDWTSAKTGDNAPNEALQDCTAPARVYCIETDI